MAKCPPEFALVAGEASGDMLGSLLLQGVQQRWPGCTAVGIGGAQMAAQGLEPWWPSERLAVRGYVEVLRHYRGIVAIRNQLKDKLLMQRPDVFVGVDAPDFNLDLECDLSRAGIPTVHFVCPSVWAWRAHRLQKIRQSARHVLCIFPFEPSLLAQHGINSTYVGHPFAQSIPMQPDKLGARQALGLAEQDTVVALLPGSRASEIQYMAPNFLKTALWLAQKEPKLHFILPTLPNLRTALERCMRQVGTVPNLKILQGQSQLALAACDVALVASGTATLEAALFKRPMVIAYKMAWLSWQIMQRQKLQPWVGLPNILAAEFLVPEFLQEQATPMALGQAVLGWLNAPAKVHQLQQRFEVIHHSLIRDTPRLATDAIEKVLAR